MDREEMIQKIVDTIWDADLKTIEQVYWFLIEELEA